MPITAANTGAIQALHRIITEKDERIAALESKLDALAANLDALLANK